MKKIDTNIYSYIIDDNDNILSINSEKWDYFYEKNSNGSLCLSPDIIKESLWKYIDGFETSHLYKNIINNVRTYKKEITIPFRCDSPSQRRFLNLTLKPLANNHIEFISKIEKVEDREYVSLFDDTRDFSEEILISCSMCKKIKLEENLWEEVETAVISLKLFEKPKLPMLSHGLCPYCHKLSMDEVDKFLKSIDE